jgi:hypothetical protein
MFFSMPGWACVLVSMRKMMKGAQLAFKSGDATP